MLRKFLPLLTLSFFVSPSLAQESSKKPLRVNHLLELKEASQAWTAEIKTPFTQFTQKIPNGLKRVHFRDIEIDSDSKELTLGKELILRDKDGKKIAAELIGPKSTTSPRVSPKGALMIHGGGRLTRDFIRRFGQLAGGRNAKIVFIPTAMGGDIDPKTHSTGWLKQVGFKNITVLHTKSPKVANSKDFIAPLKEAKAIWLSGGRQWRTADAYLNTLVQAEIQRIYQEGGVIAGSSAGATIQGDYLVRGDPRGNRRMMSPGHEQGFGLLPNTTIDQHVIARNRLKDLIPVIQRFPHLLGLGIDEGTAIIVQGDAFEVIGESKVAIYDARRWAEKTDSEERHFFLESGDRYDLRKRKQLKAAK